MQRKIDINQILIAPDKEVPLGKAPSNTFLSNDKKSQLINADKKQKLLKQLTELKSTISKCSKNLSQNRIESKKLGSISALSQQLVSITKKVTSINDGIFDSIVIKPVEKSTSKV